MGLVERGKLPKPLTHLLSLSRSYSLWVYQWGLACCAIEMGAAFGSPRYDVMRLGVIPFPASPRQRAPSAGSLAQRGGGARATAPGAAPRVQCTLGRCTGPTALWSPVKPFTRVH